MAKPGENDGMPKPRTVGAETAPLYKTLLEIGTKAKSITPSALIRYGALLASEDVKRRSRVSRDPAVLARHANEALVACIFGISDPLTRLAAEAALGVGEFEGQLLKNRVEALKSRPRWAMTKDQFLYRRKLALAHIASMLGTGTPQLSPPAPLTIRATREPPVALDHATIMARQAADLHYSTLTALLLAQSAPSATLSRRPETWDAVARRVFESFIDFTVGYQDALTGLERFPQTAAAYRDRLARRWQAAVRVGPDFPPPSTEMFTQYAEGLLEFEDLPWRLWQRWYFDEWPQPAVDRLEPLAAIGGGAMEVILRATQLAAPVIAEARQAAYKTLSYHYDFDEFAPVLDGESLRHRADTFFDGERGRLANMNDLWENRV